ANPERPDFIRSPHSHVYHTADGFREALGTRGFDVRVEGAYPVAASGGSGIVSLARRGLEAVGLVPRSLRARALLKRILYGRLPEVPPELEALEGAGPSRDVLEPGPARGHKVLYVTATRGSSAAGP
ncbi:MAG: hypothetical protein D6701_06600, partial [Gemmatimonadetes bacterium]